jgi:hypothetical protein
MSELFLLFNLVFASNELDLAIDKAAQKYNIESQDLRLIAAVESSYSVNPKINENRNKTIDMGPFQVNSIHKNTTCKMFNIETLDGNVLCAAKLIAMHKKHKGTDFYWLARYHSKTPKYKKIYQEKLEKAKVLFLIADKN